jgi:glucokinase-like ROK family protein
MVERTPFRTGDQALVREINLSLIMNRLHAHAPVSRAALAAMTGLNKSTVSSLVNELIERRFVHEIGVVSTGVGRPSVQLTVNPQAGYVVSMEIGVGYIGALCTDFTANRLWASWEHTVPGAPQQTVLDQLLQLIRNTIQQGQRAMPGQRLLGIAIGVPGLVKQSDGTLLFAPNLGWREVPLCAILQDAFPDVPIFVDNEANMAALGEYFFGAAQDHRDVLYISAGVGLGGAIVRGGQLMRGASGLAGEFGHMTLYPDGALCKCGNRGCWETEVSTAAVERHVRKAISQGQPTLLQPGNLTLEGVIEAARNGDPVARTALGNVGRELGVGIASLVNALNPDLVVLGGTLSAASDFLLPTIRRELHERALEWDAAAVRVVAAEQGSQACTMGGVALVYQTILSQPGSSGQPGGGGALLLNQPMV